MEAWQYGGTAVSGYGSMEAWQYGGMAVCELDCTAYYLSAHTFVTVDRI